MSERRHHFRFEVPAECVPLPRTPWRLVAYLWATVVMAHEVTARGAASDADRLVSFETTGGMGIAGFEVGTEGTVRARLAVDRDVIEVSGEGTPEWVQRCLANLHDLTGSRPL